MGSAAFVPSVKSLLLGEVTPRLPGSRVQVWAPLWGRLSAEYTSLVRAAISIPNKSPGRHMGKSRPRGRSSWGRAPLRSSAHHSASPLQGPRRPRPRHTVPVVGVARLGLSLRQTPGSEGVCLVLRWQEGRRLPRTWGSGDGLEPVTLPSVVVLLGVVCGMGVRSAVPRASSVSLNWTAPCCPT